ncbi:MAG TPA: DinB family protein [Candidatus Elarobacter sp.]|nr:DinB family protein [Candidatus Elarobacter sp.]
MATTRMPPRSPARPEASEYNPYYGAYVSAVPEGDLLSTLERQGAELDALLAPLDDARALSRYAPGKWSIKEVLGHISDTERVFAYRLLRIARGDTTPLASFDQDVYVPAARSDARALNDLREELRAVRAATLALAKSLDDDAWLRSGTASEKPVSARALGYIIAGHMAHHTKILRERYLAVPAA